MDNQTQVSEFILLGLSQQPLQRQVLFSLSCILYLSGCLGNLLTILAIILDPHLHSPMYFFLSNLSLLDICFTSTTIPKMLVNHLCGLTTISFSACLVQMYFFIAFGAADSMLLSAMAYDRYLAICSPLHYMAIMSPSVYLAGGDALDLSQPHFHGPRYPDVPLALLHQQDPTLLL